MVPGVYKDHGPPGITKMVLVAGEAVWGVGEGQDLVGGQPGEGRGGGGAGPAAAEKVAQRGCQAAREGPAFRNVWVRSLSLTRNVNHFLGRFAVSVHGEGDGVRRDPGALTGIVV